MSAGVLVFEKPCGIVIGVRELFGSESKSQVYGHLHSLFYNGKLEDVGTEKVKFIFWNKLYLTCPFVLYNLMSLDLVTTVYTRISKYIPAVFFARSSIISRIWQ
jgi:hypothetical protein